MCRMSPFSKKKFSDNSQEHAYGKWHSIVDIHLKYFQKFSAPMEDYFRTKENNDLTRVDIT